MPVKSLPGDMIEMGHANFALGSYWVTEATDKEFEDVINGHNVSGSLLKLPHHQPARISVTGPAVPTAATHAITHNSAQTQQRFPGLLGF